MRVAVGSGDPRLIGWIITIVLFAGIVFAIRLFMKRQEEQRIAHDARMRAMAQTYLAAAKKKQAAEAAAKAAAAASPSPEAALTNARDERDCPFCAEPILKKAKVCKHCGREVQPVA